MPTRLRVDFAGYHHVINRGVNRCNVFNTSNDKDMFLQIINKTARIHKVILHTYALMDNHYHLLIETQEENISCFMRVVNANYAQYFNRKYKRSGHLWQDRYKSKFVISEDYLYSLIKYIENNPIEANITNKIASYPHTMSYKIFKNQKYYPCCENSILLKDFDIKSLRDFLNIPISNDDLKILSSKQKIEKENQEIKISREKQLCEYFKKLASKQIRNKAIIEAYKDGYPQIEIANYLSLSKSAISKIIKSGDSTSGVKCK